MSKYSSMHLVCMAYVTPIVRRIPSVISGLSIDSGMTLKTCGLREDVDTSALGLDRRKIAKSSLSSKYVFPDVLVCVSQIRCGTLQVTSDRFIPACACSKLITPITCQQRLPGLLARVSRGVLAPDCVMVFHFLLSYARRNKLSCCHLSSRKALLISYFQSSRISFHYWTVQQPHG